MWGIHEADNNCHQPFSILYQHRLFNIIVLYCVTTSLFQNLFHFLFENRIRGFGVKYDQYKRAVKIFMTPLVCENNNVRKL